MGDLILDLGVDFKEKEGGFYKKKKRNHGIFLRHCEETLLECDFIMTLS